jgi:glutamate-1-semialdehyde 2,1-aminomutase
MLKQGIYLAPSAYEAGFLSNAHSDGDLDKTINAASAAFSSI